MTIRLDRRSAPSASSRSRNTSSSGITTTHAPPRARSRSRSARNLVTYPGLIWSSSASRIAKRASWSVIVPAIIAVRGLLGHRHPREFPAAGVLRTRQAPPVPLASEGPNRASERFRSPEAVHIEPLTTPHIRDHHDGGAGRHRPPTEYVEAGGGIVTPSAELPESGEFRNQEASHDGP